MTELWLVDLDAAASALEALETETPRLSLDDRHRVGRIKDPDSRRLRLAAYTALRIVLERVAGPRVRGVAFARAPGGKPSLPHHSVAFNLSHAGTLALIGAVESGVIGVDIETPRAIKVSDRRREEILAAAAGLSSSPLRGDFLQAWTRLEAYAKVHGHGLSRVLQDLGLRSVEGRTLPAAQIVLRARQLRTASELVVRGLHLADGMTGAVAVPAGIRLPRRPRPFPNDLAEIAAMLARRGLPATRSRR